MVAVTNGGAILAVVSFNQYRFFGDPAVLVAKPTSPFSPKQIPLIPADVHASSEMGLYTPSRLSALVMVVAGAYEAGEVGDPLSPGTL